MAKKWLEEINKRAWKNRKIRQKYKSEKEFITKYLKIPLLLPQNSKRCEK